MEFETICDISKVNWYYLLDLSRKEGTLNWEQGEVIDNLWIRISSIFDFWRCLFSLMDNG